MFFSKLARILAILALVFGLLRVLTGFVVAGIEPTEVREAARARYIGSKSSGQAIDSGIYAILFAVALGTLAEISFSTRKGSTASAGQGASAMRQEQK
ncbi:hypothetical protein JQ596_16075 [Bradyrhizobium manausense]|uniref:hypothetical protein n=1 Tax=Bradyrhizobium manausense TaxID=989370 RepID=UPI001BAB4FE6|nr:hypothetical protein [Bradyrhizobium manausense]MBR0827059.1 hypothetical protein [Bradyrhizobium manausense]